MTADSDSTAPDSDITALILNDHVTFRRGFAALDDIEGGHRTDAKATAAALREAWEPLAALLDVHAVAEEEIFYPSLLRRGDDDAEDETLDAIGDHNDIRDAVRKAARHTPGSAEWWSAVGEARTANTEHMGEEEDEALADFRRNADPALRAELGRRFAAFKQRHRDQSGRVTGGLDTSDKDPQAYVATEGTPTADGSLGIGSLRSS